MQKDLFIEGSKHSAWGFRGTDYYDYIEYKRNQDFFLIIIILNSKK